MTRFALATGITAIIIAAICLTATGSLRWWLTAGALSLYLILGGLGVSFIELQFFGPALCRGKQGNKQVALSFDDGPDAASTRPLLDALEEYGVRATFFCIGEKVAAQPELLRRMVAGGHTVGNHSFHHAWWTNFLFGRRLSEEIDRAQKAIEQAAGVKPRYFRTPMGLTNPHFKKALNDAALTLVGWDVRAYDKKNEPNETIARVIERTRDGSIIAMHDGGISADKLLTAVTGVITGLQARGYRFVQLAELRDHS